MEIATGKVLMDTMTLKSLQVMDGSKIMLIASQGLHQGVIFSCLDFIILLDSFWIQIDQQNLIDATSEKKFVQAFVFFFPIVMQFS